MRPSMGNDDLEPWIGPGTYEADRIEKSPRRARPHLEPFCSGSQRFTNGRARTPGPSDYVRVNQWATAERASSSSSACRQVCSTGAPTGFGTSVARPVLLPDTQTPEELAW